MGRRAEGYVRKEITIEAGSVDETEIWKCKGCGRWHGFYRSGSTEDNGYCDECRVDLDAAEIEKCFPCKKCGVKPEWGSSFLFCPKCGQESEYNDPEGNAVRNWNIWNKDAANKEN